MYLRNKRTGRTVYLAKFYPSLGWFRPDSYHKSLNLEFSEAEFSLEELVEFYDRGLGSGPPYSGGTPENGAEWELVYEDDLHG